MRDYFYKLPENRIFKKYRSGNKNKISDLSNSSGLNDSLELAPAH